MNSIKQLLFSTSLQKILLFLAENIQGEYTEKEISKKTGVRKSAVNLALRDLERTGVVSRKKIGRSSLFKAEERSNVIREIKIILNILAVSPLVERLEKISQKVILFGSFANGTNRKKSDIDLFVLAGEPQKVRTEISSSALAERIQLIVKTPRELFLINKNKPLLFQEIEKGKVLWEKNE